MSAFMLHRFANPAFPRPWPKRMLDGTNLSAEILSVIAATSSLSLSSTAEVSLVEDCSLVSSMLACRTVESVLEVGSLRLGTLSIERLLPIPSLTM